MASLALRRERVRTGLQAAGLALLLVLVGASAVIVKKSRSEAGLPLAAVDGAEAGASAETTNFDASLLPLPVVDPLVVEETVVEDTSAEPEVLDSGYPADTRWFHGRPMRPTKTMTMTVTGYSPGEESCGDSADGITSSLHSVWTNGMKLVAADTRVLPLGTVITVPGYHGEQLVPVLDRGGKIKGNKLDLLYPTADQARQWGVKKVKITVWEYVDGKPAPDWRKVRDSKN